MATLDNILLMQKPTETVATLTSQWGIYLTEMPMLNSHERKELDIVDWLDENGDDVYCGLTAYMRAFDTDIEMVCKGSMTEIQTAYDNLLSYLTTGGTELKIYSDWVKRGRQKVTFKAVSVPEYEKTDLNGFYAKWTVTMHVSDPFTIVKCETAIDGYKLSAIS